MNILTITISIDVPDSQAAKVAQPVPLPEAAPEQNELFVQPVALNGMERVREQMRKAGRARAAQISTEERREFGRRAWETRLAKARKSKSISPTTTAGE